MKIISFIRVITLMACTIAFLDKPYKIYASNTSSHTYHALLHNNITGLLKNVEDNLTYWEKQTNRLSNPDRSRIIQISGLETLQKSLAKKLARLHHIKQKYHKIDYFEDVSIDKYNEEIIKFILGLDQDLTGDMQHPSHKYASIIKKYQCHMINTIKEFKRPNWFSEHKWPLIISGLGIAMLSGYSYHYQNSIKNYVLDHWYKLNDVWKEHVVSPLKLVWKTVLNEINYEPLITEENVNLKKESVKEETTLYLKSIDQGFVNKIFKSPSPEKELADAAEKFVEFSPNKVEEILSREEKNPYYNALFGSLPRNYLLKIKKFEYLAMKILLVAETYRKQNHLNFAIIACVPAGLLLYGTCALLKKAFGSFFSKKVYFKQFKTTLVSMEKLINKDLLQPTLPYETMGLLIYHIDKLKKLLRKTPYAERYTLQEDLIELESIEFSPQQKMATINRMYRQYDFLTA